MTAVAKEPHIVIPISCAHCGQKQVVQVRARTGFAQVSGQSLQCVTCERIFSVMVPDAIVGGPFLP
jgi:hypothetical protein